jgi:RNA polymerase sigma factor (sigma-70 family)
MTTCVDAGAPVRGDRPSGPRTPGGTLEPGSGPTPQRLRRLARPLRRAAVITLRCTRSAAGARRARGRDAFGDLFQIAVTAAWARERDGEPIRNPRAFLRQVIVNQRKMQLRSQRRHPATSFDELAATAENGGTTVDAIADRGASVSEQVEQREVAELVAQILLTIEWRARTVWTMRFLEVRPPDEIMAALDITHRQYSRLLERATTALNRKLRAYLAGDWCPGYASRFASLAAGRATPAQAEEAQAHLAVCPSCRTAYETFTRLHPAPSSP